MTCLHCIWSNNKFKVFMAALFRPRPLPKFRQMIPCVKTCKHTKRNGMIYLEIYAAHCVCWLFDFFVFAAQSAYIEAAHGWIWYTEVIFRDGARHVRTAPRPATSDFLSQTLRRPPPLHSHPLTHQMSTARRARERWPQCVKGSRA